MELNKPKKQIIVKFSHNKFNQHIRLNHAEKKTPKSTLMN